MLAFPGAAKPTLTVTYKCADGHHSIRWYEIPAPVPCDVLCSACGGVAVVEFDEKERHRKLLSGLDQYLI